MKIFHPLKNPASWRRISIAVWNAPNDPTVYGKLEIDATAALAHLEKLNRGGSATGDSPVKITMTHLAARAIALTLHKFPDINGIIKWKKIYLRKTVDIFLQVAIEEGNEGERPDLSGAKIDACENKSVVQIARELKDKSGQIRRKEDPQFKATIRLLNLVPTFLLSWVIRFLTFLNYNLGVNLTGLGVPRDPFGSVMITSVGSLGMPPGYAPLVPISRVPIIVCVGQVAEKPWVAAGAVVVRPILELKFTFDHRFIDGLTGSRMAKYFRELLENPSDNLL
ncbi:MAG: 2-oxo acid dehydrogenase subunit E2 [Deltaproteobacteria bacterium]|nr:2-oxo acid dehydrogenase subunit E2 [Deltaproteobacteria bacterium]